jgi:ribonuclease T2
VKSSQLPRWSSILVFVIVAAVYLYQQFAAPGGALPSDSITPTPVVAKPAGPSPTLPPSSSGTGSQAKFDFYLLDLSWSPDYCATSGNDDPQQCSIGKKLGFVLHGLWPQYNQGYPSDCSNVRLPDSVKAKFPGLYPNDSLFTHEWEKHGTCSGLSPEQYLTLSKQLKESVTIPAAYRAPEQPFRTTTAQLKKDFVAANSAFSEAGLAVNCSGSGRYLQELQICFSLDGKPVSCSREVLNDAAKSCQAADFLVRNVK